MSGGVLEVLLANAEGIKQAWLLGSSTYVIIECGAHSLTSKLTSDENGNAWWNEKFSFNLSSMELMKLTKIRLSIMGKNMLFQDYPIGEATIRVMDILKEANYRGSIELKPSSYNIVLSDSTYKGEIKVGLKVNTDVTVEEVRPRDAGSSLAEKCESQSLCKMLLSSLNIRPNLRP